MEKVDCVPCSGGRKTASSGNRASARPSNTRVASAEMFMNASARYVVVSRQADADGKRFSTLTAAQDYARRSGGIIRHL